MDDDGCDDQRENHRSGAAGGPRRPAFGEVEAAAAGFEHLPFIMVVGEGPQLRAVGFNAAARAFTQDRYVVGTPFDDLFPAEVLGQGWSDWYRTPLATGQTVSVAESRMQLQQPDGTAVDVYLDATFAPWLGADGRPRGTVVFSQDVTDRVRQRQLVEAELTQLREQYAAARGGVRAMQRALLPDSVPVAVGMDVAARYLLASDEAVAGGDWFDAVAREDGSTALVVGDVVGHGQDAAVAMGQLRSVLRSQLMAGAGVVQALQFLDVFAASVPHARRATVCVAVVEADGAVEYCTAGHPPPLVVAAAAAESRSDGRPGGRSPGGAGAGGPSGGLAGGLAGGEDRYLPPSGSGPLVTGSTFTTAHAHLQEDEAVVLYSDGILERPGTTPPAAVVALRQTAGAAARNAIMPVGAPRSAAERICTLSLELLTRQHGYVDDITVLALVRRAAVPDLDLAIDLDVDSGLDVELGVSAAVGAGVTPAARSALRGWLQEVGAGERDTRTLLQAVTELVANVVDHAYLGAGTSRPLRLRARLRPGGQVVVEVSDRGSWKLPIVTSSRGRGLALVRHLVHELQLDRSPRGTTASIVHSLSRPAGLLSTDRVTPGGAPGRPADPRDQDAEHFDVWSRGGSAPTLTVVGPLDGVNAPELSGYLDLAMTEADRVLTVDLGRVTVLASAGVNLLFTVVEQARAVDVEVDLIAPNGSPAQHVLDLVRLPYRQRARTAS